MAGWNDLAKDMKMLVTIHNEREAGRPVWFSRLAELLKDEMTKRDISYLEDRLYDIGVIDKKYERCMDSKWGSCYLIEPEALGFVKNVAEHLTDYPIGVDG